MIAVDTSVAVPALLPWHEAHVQCHQRVVGASVAAHVLVETYSVLTRLPAPHRLTEAVAQQLIQRRFGTRVLLPSSGLARGFVERLAAAGVGGGASYDGIVALTVAEHRGALVTRDTRAATTYRTLAVDFELLDG